MLIKQGYSHLEGKAFEMSNLDYYKRYIILNLPPDDMSGGNDYQSLTIINISARTGSGPIRLLADSERVQETNIYHCISPSLWKQIPYGNIDNKEIKLHDYINTMAPVIVSDVSYGTHYYDLIRGIGKDFEQITSYSRYLNLNGDEYIKYRKGGVSRLLPDPLFYNDEHQLFARQTNNFNAKTALFLDNLVDNYEPEITNDYPILWRFQDFLDENTKVIISKLQKPLESTEDSEYLSEEVLHVSELEYLHSTTCGILYDTMLYMLVDEVNFCIDSKDGMSPIEYKSNHKLSTNKLYLDELTNGFIQQVDYNMSLILEEINYTLLERNINLRIFIKGSIENLNIGYVFYNSDGKIVKSYTYYNKNTMHDNTVRFIRNHF